MRKEHHNDPTRFVRTHADAVFITVILAPAGAFALIASVNSAKAMTDDPRCLQVDCGGGPSGGGAPAPKAIWWQWLAEIKTPSGTIPGHGCPKKQKDCPYNDSKCACALDSQGVISCICYSGICPKVECYEAECRAIKLKF